MNTNDSSKRGLAPPKEKASPPPGNDANHEQPDSVRLDHTSWQLANSARSAAYEAPSETKGMILGSYQQKCVDAVLASWRRFTRLLGTALTGSGQPIMFGEICRPRLEFGRQNQPAFVAALRRSAPRTDKELRRLRRRLTALITHRHGQLLGLVAKKAAVETELVARRGFSTSL
jgi:hypothetical protein